jgi:hypothetical protein
MGRRSLSGGSQTCLASAMENKTATPEVAANASAASDRIASMLLDVAGKLDAQEKKFRASLKRAAAAGDLAMVREILDVWDKGVDFEG